MLCDKNAGSAVWAFYSGRWKRGRSNNDRNNNNTDLFAATQLALCNHENGATSTTSHLSMLTPGGSGNEYTQEDLYTEEQIQGDGLVEFLLGMLIDSLLLNTTAVILPAIEGVAHAFLSNTVQNTADQATLEKMMQEMAVQVAKMKQNVTSKATALHDNVRAKIETETATDANIKLFLARRATLLRVLGLYPMFVALGINSGTVYRYLCREKKTAPSVSNSNNRYLYRFMAQKTFRLQVTWPEEFVGLSLVEIYPKGFLEMAMDKVRLLEGALAESAHRYHIQYPDEVRRLKTEGATLETLSTVATPFKEGGVLEEKAGEPRIGECHVNMAQLVRQLMRDSLNYRESTATTTKEFQQYCDDFRAEIELMQTTNLVQPAHVPVLKQGPGSAFPRAVHIGCFKATDTTTSIAATSASRREQANQAIRGHVRARPLAPVCDGGVVQVARLPRNAQTWAATTGARVQTAPIVGDSNDGAYQGEKWMKNVAASKGKTRASAVEGKAPYSTTRSDARFITGLDCCPICHQQMGQELHHEAALHSVTREIVCVLCFNSSLFASTATELDSLGELVQHKHPVCHRCAVAVSTTEYWNTTQFRHEHQFCTDCDQILFEKSSTTGLNGASSKPRTCPVCTRTPGTPEAVLAMMYYIFINSRVSPSLGLTLAQRINGENALKEYDEHKRNKDGNNKITEENIQRSCSEVQHMAILLRDQIATALAQEEGEEQDAKEKEAKKKEVRVSFQRMHFLTYAVQWYNTVRSVAQATVFLEAAQGFIVGYGENEPLSLGQRRCRVEKYTVDQNKVVHYLVTHNVRREPRAQLLAACGVDTVEDLSMDLLTALAVSVSPNDAAPLCKTQALAKLIVRTSAIAPLRFPINPRHTCAVGQLLPRSPGGAGFTMSESLHFGLALSIVPPLLVRLFLLLSTPTKWSGVNMLQLMVGNCSYFQHKGMRVDGQQVSWKVAIPLDGVDMGFFALADEKEIQALVSELEATDLQNALFFAPPANSDTADLREWREAFVRFVWNVNVKWKKIWAMLRHVSVHWSLNQS